jgi:hypothetical protein
VLADSERILGPKHPATQSIRAELAAAYHKAERSTDLLRSEGTDLARSDFLDDQTHTKTMPNPRTALEPACPIMLLMTSLDNSQGLALVECKTTAK